MDLYHFSDTYYEPDSCIPIGNFGNFIVTESEIVQKFELLMEQKRVLSQVNSPSRLNCLFTFSKNVAEGFKTQRKFLYELDASEEEKIYKHNYEVGTYFSKLFMYNDIDLIKEDENLMLDYWTCPVNYRNHLGLSIDYGEEILVANPLKVKKIIIWNKLTVDDFINLNLPFYHITPTSNLESIIQNGLQDRNGLGICVSQSKHPLIIKYITEMMLNNEENNDFSIIKILPRNHNILKNEIKKDNVEEATNEIHNYIKRDNLIISINDVVDTYVADPLGIKNVNDLVQELNRKGLLTSLF